MNKILEYIENAPLENQPILLKIRKIILDINPKIVETFAYGMPAYKLNDKPLVYFAYFANHIGFYATPRAHEEFADELSKYKQGKGSVQFPLDKPMPYDLISKMTKYKIKQILENN